MVDHLKVQRAHGSALHCITSGAIDVPWMNDEAKLNQAGELTRERVPATDDERGWQLAITRH